MKTSRISSRVAPLVSAPRTWVLSSCGRLSAHSIARLRKLRVLCVRPSRPQTTPQQYSVVRSCIGRLKSSAEAIALSTNSLPRTLLRIWRPRSYVALSMSVSNLQLVFGPERLGQRQLRREYRDGNAGLPLHDGHPGADAAALFVELDFAERVIFGGTGIHGAQRVGHRDTISLAGLFERVLDHPHVAIGGDRILRHPGFLVAGLEFGDQCLVALGAPACDAGKQTLQQFRADGLQHVGFGDCNAERDGWNLALSEPELVHFLEQQLGVGNHRRQEEQKV